MDDFLTDYAEFYRAALTDVDNWAPLDFTLNDIDYFTADLLTIRMLPEPSSINPGGLLDN